MKQVAKEYKCERWYGDFHKWSKWGEPALRTWESAVFKTSGTSLTQERKCSACGRVEVRSV